MNIYLTIALFFTLHVGGWTSLLNKDFQCQSRIMHRSESYMGLNSGILLYDKVPSLRKYTCDTKNPLFYEVYTYIQKDLYCDIDF
jgi:hypothetical protein